MIIRGIQQVREECVSQQLFVLKEEPHQLLDRNTYAIIEHPQGYAQ